MHWPGIGPGDSRALGLSERTYRRLKRLLEALALNWENLELTRFPVAEYRDANPDLIVPVLRKDGEEDPDLFVLVEFLPDSDAEETYLLVEFKTELQKTTRALAETASRHQLLRMQGSWPVELEHNEWFVRALPLSGVEGQPQDSQLAQITEFIRGTVVAVEASGLLDIQLPRRRPQGTRDPEEGYP